MNRADRIPVGRLRHRVALQEPVDSDDGAGGSIRTWQSVVTLWARLEPLVAAERVAAGRLEAAADHRITLRWRAGVTHDMRFVSGNRVFAIRALIDRDEARRFLDCLCEEIVP